MYMKKNLSAFNLNNWLRENDVSQADYAEKIGISKATLSRILNGHHKPNIDVAFAIESTTDGVVTVKGWTIPVTIRAEIVAA
jgi:DNA-binding XRE family transcriptional regulator